MRVLVTDAELGLTVGAIRSLARRGAEVIAVAARGHAIGFRSRYVSERAVGPAPETADAFVAFLADVVTHHDVDAVLPVGEPATRALSHRRDDFPAALAVPAPDPLEIARSKRRTLELARVVGVRVPAETGPFPLVAKRDVGSGGVRYVNAREDIPDGGEWLVQEYVPGEGRGFFALMEHGEERASFMHRRLREFPVTGGASTSAESVHDPELQHLGLLLLRELRWHGPAMVEFKLDARDGGYTLMEINPKLWGSLQLAIAAGVDFPWLAVRLALGERINPPQYRVGMRFQWVFRDLARASARKRNLWPWALDLINPLVRKDVSLRDLGPHLAEARATMARLPQGRSPRATRIRDPK